MSKHQEARAKGKVKMLAAFCTERSFQHEDQGWTFDPKIWCWLEQFKSSIQHRSVWRHLPKHLPPTTAPKPGLGHCPAEQSSATRHYLIDNINVMIGHDTILTIGSFFLFALIARFPNFQHKYSARAWCGNAAEVTAKSWALSTETAKKS